MNFNAPYFNKRNLQMKPTLKPVLIFTAIFVLLTQFKGFGQNSPPQIFAVVVGIQNYKDDKITDLKFAEKDAQQFYNVLRSPICGAVPEENISLLVGSQATLANITKEVSTKFSRAGANDMVVFYFSGHGVGGEFQNDGYLLSYDTETGYESSTALSMDVVASKLQKSQAKSKVSYVDACHSGYFKALQKGSPADENAAISKAILEGIAAAGDGNVSFNSTTARQNSLEDLKLGHGVFTYYLIEGLKGEADRFRKDTKGYANGIVTISELASYVQSKVESRTKFEQRPSVEGVFDDNFPLSVVNPNVSMSTEMAKMPPRKVMIANVAKQAIGEKPLAERYDLADKKLKPVNSAVGGYFNFINGFKEPILVYHIKNTCSNCNLMISPGLKTRSPLLYVGNYNSSTGETNNTIAEYKFYFRTIDESKPIRYGMLILEAETFVEKSLILSPDNLYLSVDGPKF